MDRHLRSGRDGLRRLRRLKAVMTADTHVRCTTRTAEAMLKIEEMTGQRADIVVMVQGDDP